jgi:2-haloacid dehalogenase
MPKHVVWDIVGTVVGYEAVEEAVTERLGTKLLERNIAPTVLVHLLEETAEREYTFLSMSGKYVNYFDCIKTLFPRVLAQCGIEDPKTFVSQRDLDHILSQYSKLRARPGAAECWAKLREAGFTMWAFTSGDPNMVEGYLKDNGIECPPETFRSCDDLGVGKPDPECYKPLLKEFKDAGEEAWFAAAHQWDVSAAKRTGFKGAYVTVLERIACNDLFGEMDVTADSFEALADGIIRASQAS